MACAFQLDKLKNINDMKKVLFAMMMLLPMTASAYDVEIDGIYYNLIEKAKIAEVTSGGNYEGDIVIPSSIDYDGKTYTVETISDDAFSYSNIYTIKLASSITTIGNRAFRGCWKLETVILPQGLLDIGEDAFMGCSTLSSIEIPNTVTTIGRCAFLDCSELSSIVIPNSITKLNGSVFQGCKKLSSVILPNSMTEIGESSFMGCTSLLSFDIPNSVTYIGMSAFAGCIGLTDIVIPNNVTFIASWAFSNCEGLKTIKIGNSVNKIVNEAFAGCKSLEDVYCYNEMVPTTSNDAFNDSYIEYVTLHVPANSINNYKTTEPWSNFKNVVAIDNSSTAKCAVPTIAYSDGKLTFTCKTEGAECVANISDADIKTHYGNEIQLSATYTVSVYATATGYENSDIATATLCWIDTDPKTEGIENGVAQVRANAVLIQSHDGTLSIAGIADGTDIAVYSTSGQMVGSAKAHGATSTITTTLRSGNVAIIRIGDKSVKFVMQ